MRTLPAPPTTPLPDGFRVRLTARRHPGGVLESSLRPAVVRTAPAVHAVLEHDQVQVGRHADAHLVRRLMELDAAVPCPRDGAGSPDLSELTVVIPVRDRPGPLGRLLQRLTLAGQSSSPGPRVLVVDDASADPAGIKRACRTHGAGLLRLPVNQGPAGARSAGLAAATTPYVALVDSDVTLGVEDLARLLGELADPRVAVAAPRVLAATAPAAHPVIRYDQRWGALDLGPAGGLAGPGRPVSYVPTACWVGRTQVLRDGFDDALRVGEDVDLAWRLTDRGWWVRYVPEVTVRHASRPGLRPWWDQHAGYGESAGPLARRHGAYLAPARYTAAGLAVAVSLLAPAPWAALVTPGVHAVTLVRLHRRLAPLGLPFRTVLRLAAAGTRANLEQSAGLVCRYWFWPLLLTAPASATVRRLLLRAVVLDAALRLRHPADLVLVGLRVLENAAFAWGTLRGVVRGGSIRAVVPVLVGARRNRKPAGRPPEAQPAGRR